MILVLIFINYVDICKCQGQVKKNYDKPRIETIPYELYSFNQQIYCRAFKFEIELLII